MWIEKLDGEKREVDFPELFSLKKDILLFFDDAIGEGSLCNSYLPKYAYDKPYWEYLLLDGDEYFYEDEKFFYLAGCLCLIIAMSHEYLDYASGDREIFGVHSLTDIEKYIQRLNSENAVIVELSNLALLGLRLVNEAVLNSDEYEHPELNQLYEGGRWVHDSVILEYYNHEIS